MLDDYIQQPPDGDRKPGLADQLPSGRPSTPTPGTSNARHLVSSWVARARDAKMAVSIKPYGEDW
jgi:hypothetical protein